MSNSPLVDYVKISPNKTSPRNHKIDTITIHSVVGQCHVEVLGNIFADPARQASCNYGIGPDGRVGLYVDEGDRSWCSSSSSNDNRAITIEVATDTFEPYAVTDAAYESLIKLLVDICQRNNIDALRWLGDKHLVGQVDQQNMTVHKWFAATSCPNTFLLSKHHDIATEVNRRLTENNHQDTNIMSKEEFTKLWLEMRKDLQDNDASDYSKEAREWAVSSGLIQGNNSEDFNGMWQDILTREQFVTVLYRYDQMKK